MASLPLPTQGFAALALLKLLEGFDLAALDEADYVHLVVEATKLAFEDRDRYLADPAVARPGRTLSGLRAARRQAHPHFSARGHGRGRAAGRRRHRGHRHGWDAAGNAVAVIQSTYHEFGAAVVAGDTGVLLQNRGASFSPDLSIQLSGAAPRARRTP